MRVVVLGATGMLGHKVLQTLSEEGFDVMGTVRSRLAELGPIGEFLSGHGTIIEGVDALQFPSVEAALDSSRPEAVINAVGIVKQKPEAADYVTSLTVNSLLPHQLHRWCEASDARLLHVSTDCVFDGRRGSYTEADRPNATDLYGRSKALGEVDGPGALTLRTSIIGRQLVGSDSLVEWFLSNEGGEVEGFAGAIYTGLTTRQVSKDIAEILRDHPTLGGIYHLAGPRITKYDLLQQIKRLMNLDISIIRSTDVVIDRSLIGDRLVAATGMVAPSWPEMIEEMVQDPTQYREMR